MNLHILNYYLSKFHNRRLVCRKMGIHPSTLKYHLGERKGMKPKTLAQYNKGFKNYMDEIYKIDYTMQDPVKYGRYMRIRFFMEFNFYPEEVNV